MDHVLRLGGLGTVLDVTCTGEAADELASSMRTAWSRCLLDDARTESGLTVEAHLDDPAALVPRLMHTTQEITRALISAQAGRLLMLHAGAVSRCDTGESLVYVAAGGTGKTTLTRRLGRRFGYLTDETVGITASGAILPYPKPLSIRRRDNAFLKDEPSPDSLGLRPAPTSPRASRVVFLTRDADATTAEIEELTTMDAVFAAMAETSSLARLDRPLNRLADLLEAAGPPLRVRYAEAADIEDDLADLLGGDA